MNDIAYSVRCTNILICRRSERGESAENAYRDGVLFVGSVSNSTLHPTDFPMKRRTIRKKIMCLLKRCVIRGKTRKKFFSTPRQSDIACPCILRNREVWLLSPKCISDEVLEILDLSPRSEPAGKCRSTNNCSVNHRKIWCNKLLTKVSFFFIFKKQPKKIPFLIAGNENVQGFVSAIIYQTYNPR